MPQSPETANTSARPRRRCGRHCQRRLKRRGLSDLIPLRASPLSIVLLSLGLAPGCGGAPSQGGTVRPIQPAAPAQNQPPVSGQAGPLAPTDLQFVEVSTGTVFFSLQREDGLLRVGDHVVGQLLPDGTFVFSHTEAGVTASLSDAGRVLIVASEGVDLTKIPGELGRLLRDYGGSVESGYTIQQDGNATIPRGRPVSLSAEGHLSEGGLAVQGLTPQTRRTAMFVYVLLSTIIP